MRFPIFLTLLFLPFLGCQKLKPFPEKISYQFSEDPLSSFYQERMVAIKGKNFDSSQVSNKHLDFRMVEALEKLNMILNDPSELPKDTRETLKKSGLEKITIASASRSPYHQASLGASYKASPFKSNHLLGMAVDLEMNGKPFDVKRRGREDQVVKTYNALKVAMAQAGLFFSEPVKKDPNHVELLAWSRKSKDPSFNFEAWKADALSFMRAMERKMERIHREMPRSGEKRRFERQIIDLEKRIDELQKAQDPTLLGGKQGS